MRRPRIGLTMDVDEAGGDDRLPRSYAEAVLAAGGLPIPVPCASEPAAGAYLALCQGLVITGGAFDIPPERYGEARRASCGPQKPLRTSFEWALCEAAFAGRIPVLGVCGGMQLMNVVRGGTLHQDLGEDLGNHGHEQPLPRDVPCHPVAVVPETLLARLAGGDPLDVNSSHHQAVREAGVGVLVSARALDGVVEALELPDLPFALGVQWHPERLHGRDARQLAIWRGLVQAAGDVQR
jgi:putative glutamine amidotransferase